MEQKVPSCMLNEGGTFLMADERLLPNGSTNCYQICFSNVIKPFSSEDVNRLSCFSGVVYSSAEVS